MKKRVLKSRVLLRSNHPSGVTLHEDVIGIGKRTYLKRYCSTTDRVDILALTKDKKLILLSEYRTILKSYQLQIPTGSIEKGRVPLQVAKQELAEEIGFKAGKIKKVLEFYPSFGSLRQKAILYLAEDLKPVKMHRGSHEDIRKIHFLSLKEALRLVNKGKIKHEGTIIAIYYLASKA